MKIAPIEASFQNDPFRIQAAPKENDFKLALISKHFKDENENEYIFYFYRVF